MDSEGKYRSLEVSSANVLQVTSEDYQERSLQFKRTTTLNCNSVLRIMYIMLNDVSGLPGLRLCQEVFLRLYKFETIRAEL
jgi:hypothetical protein